MNSAHVTPLLRFRGLAKTTTDGKRLFDIGELSVPNGACILLSGRNGVGKTTLLKIIAGLEPPDRATVEYDGVVEPWRVARRRYRDAVIYLHQHPYLFDLRVDANVAYGLRAAGVARSEVAWRVAEALATSGLMHLSARNARELSGGERQRVALARAMVLAPRLLLLDEPFASLDDEARERTTALIADLKLRRIAVLLTSHERLSLAALTDCHYELDRGRLELLSASPTGAALPFDGASVSRPARLAEDFRP